MSNKKQYFLIEYFFKKPHYNEGKEIYLCENEEKAIQKINEIINRINKKIKDMCDYHREKYYPEDIFYRINEITTIEKFKLVNSFFCYDIDGTFEYVEFDYKIKVKKVFNNNGIITIQK